MLIYSITMDLLNVNYTILKMYLNVNLFDYHGPIKC